MNGRCGESSDEIVSRDLSHFLLEETLLSPAIAERSRGMLAAHIAIIGAGPAGLSAAHILGQLGYRVTIFEALPVVGGLLAAGIPAFRRPPDLLARITQALLTPEMTLRLNTSVGRDLSFQQVRAQFDGVVLAIGAHQSVPLNIAGENLLQEIYPAISFLQQRSLHESHYTRRRVAVMGGGMATLDVAREAVRAGAECVRVFFPGSLAQLPALAEEKAAALAEGVIFHAGLVPVSILGNEEATVSGLRCARVEEAAVAVQQPWSRLAVPGTLCSYAADMIVSARAERPDFSCLSAEDASGNLVCQSAADGSLALLPGVFLAGDAAEGPRTILRAIASGRKVAQRIHQSFLSRTSLEGGRKK